MYLIFSVCKISNELANYYKRKLWPIHILYKYQVLKSTFKLRYKISKKYNATASGLSKDNKLTCRSSNPCSGIPLGSKIQKVSADHGIGKFRQAPQKRWGVFQCSLSKRKLILWQCSGVLGKDKLLTLLRVPF